MKIDDSLGKLGPSDFTILRVLGCGAFGKVYLVRKREVHDESPDQRKVYAMKALRKALVLKKEKNREHLITERKVLESVRDCPFLIHLHYAFQTTERLFLVMDFIPGGEIFTQLLERGKFSADETQFYTCELVVALETLHALGIIYRDLKLENVLLDSTGHVVLTDFGLSKQFDGDSNNWTYSYCGTVEYMAPEVIRQKSAYTYVADWWSLGVFMYELLTGTSPFTLAGRDNSQSAVALRVTSGKYPRLPPRFKMDTINVVEELLQVNPKTRLGTRGVDQIKGHPFFKNVNWEDVAAKKGIPPFAPLVRGDVDVSNFSADFTNQAPLLSPALDPHLHKESFNGFSFHPRLIKEKFQPFEHSVIRLQQLQKFKKSDFFLKYSLDLEQAPLGRGTYSTVRRCTRLADGAQFAVKLINKTIWCDNEVSTLQACQSHPGVVRLEEVVYDRFFCYIVTELLTGGELIKRLQAGHHFRELEACLTFRAIVSILEYIHSKGVVHRDLKPENIVYTSDSPDAQVKIIDFGFARFCTSALSTPCYTRPYAAPEVTSSEPGRTYDNACDLWSLGMILYVMLSGQLPFQGKGESAILEEMKAGHLSTAGPEWQEISENAKALVQGLLTVDPQQRLKLDHVIQSTWLNSPAPETPLQLPARDPLSLSHGFNRISAIYMKAEKSGAFRLQDVSNAPLAKRRRKKKESETGGSSCESSTLSASSQDSQSRPTSFGEPLTISADEDSDAVDADADPRDEEFTSSYDNMLAQ